MTILQLDLEIALLKNEVQQVCTRQQSLRDVLVSLRHIARNMDLDFDDAGSQAETVFNEECVLGVPRD